MKKIIGILFFSAMLLCAGCGQDEDGSVQDEINEPSASPKVIENIPTSAGSQVPYWAQGVQEDGKLFKGLNLDGVGDADDEAYVSIYKFGDEYHSSWVTVLRVHLGTGETMSELFPVMGYYDFKTGKILSEDRDAIILGIQERASNYNATHFWVLKVYPAKSVDEYSGAGMWIALDTTAQPNGMSLDILKDNGSTWGIVGNDGSTLMTWTPEVVDIEGSSLQGLKVTIYGDNSTEWENVICWKDGLWDDGNRTYIGKWEFLGDWTPKAE